MTTTESSLLTPSLFNIQYPNCRRGMFSLREPFKNVPTENFPTEQRQESTRRTTPPAEEPNNLDTNPAPPNEEQPIEPIPIRQKSKRNAHVQCSLLAPSVHHDMAVQTKIDRHKPPVNYYDDDNDISPRYYRHKKLQPVKQQQHQKIYEIWDVESAPPIRYKEIPRARHRKPIIEYPDEEEFESDHEERIVYARLPRKTIKKTYLPPNVRMICVRDDANRVSY